MIQDLKGSVFKNEFSLRREPNDNDQVFVFDNRSVLTKGDGKDCQISLPYAKDFDKKKLIYLFLIDDVAYYLFKGDERTVDIAGFTFKSVQIFRQANPKTTCFAGFTAYHLYEWYSKNRFCGRCGCKVVHSENERALICPECSNVVYPKIAPAVIVGITDGDKIVVTRYNGRVYTGFSLVAGFCEIGESFEQTAIREAQEEVGLKIKDLKYFGSQPWGVDSNILVGYMAKVDGSTIIKRDQNELSEALWVSREDIEAQDDPISLTKLMIASFKKNGY